MLLIISIQVVLSTLILSRFLQFIGKNSAKINSGSHFYHEFTFVVINIKPLWGYT
jgi:hypothetical protein